VAWQKYQTNSSWRSPSIKRKQWRHKHLGIESNMGGVNAVTGSMEKKHESNNRKNPSAGARIGACFSSQSSSARGSAWRAYVA